MSDTFVDNLKKMINKTISPEELYSSLDEKSCITSYNQEVNERLHDLKISFCILFYSYKKENKLKLNDLISNMDQQLKDYFSSISKNTKKK